MTVERKIHIGPLHARFEVGPPSIWPPKAARFKYADAWRGWIVQCGFALVLIQVGWMRRAASSETGGETK